MSAFPLSPTQRRLAERSRSDARIRVAFRTGSTRTSAEWNARLSRAAARHEILRTRLEVPSGLKLPVQVITDETQVQCTAVGDTLTIEASAALLDARSMLLLAAELERDAGDDDPMQFADAAEWLNELLAEPEGAEARAFWQRRHESMGALPFGSTPGFDAANGPRMGTEHAVLGSTSAPTILAALAILVRRLDETRHTQLALELDGRMHQDLESALGPFSRWAPLGRAPELSVSIAEHRRWAEREIEELTTLQAQLAHPETTPDPRISLRFEDLRDLPSNWTLESLRDERFETTLAFVASQTAQGWELRLHHDSEVVSPARARLLIEQLESLVRDAAEGTKIAHALDALPASHRKLALEQWSPPIHPPEAERLDRVIEHRARQHPDAPVVLADQTVSYGEVRVRAQAIAAALTGRGVKRGDRVALCISRSADLIAAMVGIWRCGAAYVPIDPAYPEQRIRFLLDDSKAVCTITDGADTRFAEAIQLDSLPAESSSADAVGDVDDVAYVIYTSGSTGRPKGVQVTHRQLHVSTASRLAHYGGGPDVFLLLSSYAFDSSVAGIFWTLSTGGALVFPAEGEERDPERLAARVRERGVRTLLTLPSLYSLLLEHDLTGLRTAIVAGEACPPSLVETHLERFPSCTLHNEYGPTEATVWSTVWQADGPRRRIPIGGPVAHARLYVVDTRGALAPLGASGELWIGGAGVAKGYLDRPELDAARFGADPFGEGRIYRSGDRVRWCEGELEFLGRIDDQVKVRGFRIELGEIENALGALPGVREAVATVQGEAESARLLGYLVSDGPLDTQALRAELSARLPAYMVPGLVRIDDLPRTPNGKVDRERLPHPDSLGRATSTEYVAPRDATEEVVAGIWGQVLNVERVGVEDDFFELGGTSLVVTQVIARVRQAFRIDVSLRVLFDHPRVASLVQELRKSHGDRVDKIAPLLLELARANTDEAAEVVAAHGRE